MTELTKKHILPPYVPDEEEYKGDIKPTCSKNLLKNFKEDRPPYSIEDLYCGGGDGDGISDHCLLNCECAYTKKEELVKGLGYLVLRELGL